MPVIKVERPDDPDWNGHVADHVLTACTHHQTVVVVFVGQVGHRPLHVLLLTKDLATNLNNFFLLLLFRHQAFKFKMIKKILSIWLM